MQYDLCENIVRETSSTHCSLPSIYLCPLAPPLPHHHPPPPSCIRQASQQPVAMRYCWACHHGSKFSIIFSRPRFHVHPLTYTFSCDVGGLSLSPWVFPGPAGEQFTCEQNSNAATCYDMVKSCHIFSMTSRASVCIAWQISAHTTLCACDT